MNKINILDSSVYNRIAAGEVVERPASVLKEFLDNSIDAGASNILINVLEGGIEKIEVIDDGCGIEYDDLTRTFLPHSTSKIKSLEDLEKIGTLGFRGEALASIGAVSEVTICSKTENSEYGGKISISGGKQEKVQEIGFQKGTKVCMNNLFFNVPARAKFLKKPRQEASEITNLVARYILANPNTKFKYTLDNIEIYSSTGNGLFEAIYTVYGKQTTEQIIEVNYKSDDNIIVSGYIGRPTFSKPNRTYQTLTVNNRYVQNSMVSLCVYNAFEHYLMKGQFPFFVLNLQMPLDTLDVNVHPNKMDIRFENSNHIYGIVYQAVMNALNQFSSAITEVTTKVYNYQPANTVGVSFNKENKENATVQIISNTDTKENTQTQSIKFYENLATADSGLKQSNIVFSNVFDKMLQPNNETTTQVEQGEKEAIIFPKQIIDQTQQVKQAKQQNMFNGEVYRYIGTLFETYLVVQAGDNCYFIDQHAGHERLLFDKFSRQVNEESISIQGLLVPYTISVNSLEKQFLTDNLENLKNLGFDICEFGNNSFKVSTIPSILSGINLNLFFSEILKELSVFKQLKNSDLILTKLMQHSCKTAVKAGDKLQQNEVEALIKEIEDTSMTLQCPHGRPVVVKVSKKELEKWFKRTV